MKEKKIKTEYITLGQFLKFADIISSGAEAKIYLSEYFVYVNDEKENRRGRKLYPGDVIKIENSKFIIGKEI